MENTQILEITSVTGTPFQVAKTDNESLSLICGKYRIELEENDVEKLSENLKKHNWMAIGLLIEAMTRDINEEKFNKLDENLEKYKKFDEEIEELLK